MHQTQYVRVRRMLLLILFANLAVAVLKMIVGGLARSAAIVADGMHSMTDGFSNIVGLVGVVLAARPVDEDHPYGHAKFETLAGMGIGMLMALVAAQLVKTAVERFITPVQPQISTLSLAVLVGTFVVNYVVYKVEHRTGKRLNSQILVTDALHTRSDLLVTLSVFATSLGIRLGLPVYIDPIITLVVALFIGWSAWGIFRAASNVLLDRAGCDHAEVENIALGFEQVMAVHKVRSRGIGEFINMDMHIQVEPDMHVDESHALVHRIQDALRARYGDGLQCVIHTEPYHHTPET